MQSLLILGVIVYIIVRIADCLEISLPFVKPATRRRWLEARAAKLQQEAYHLHERIAALHEEEKAGDRSNDTLTLPINTA